MSDADDILGLETALEERARKLTEEHLINGRQARELILGQTRQRLRLEEEREMPAIEALAERAYRQRIQAVELKLRAGLDRLRWQLADRVLGQLPARLAALAEDESRYLPLLAGYLRDCAQAIERDDLVAQFNARDLQRLQRDWQRYAKKAAPGKQLTLAPQPLDSIGGVLVISADRNIRFDNTFEARMERLTDTLQGSIAERLIPQSLEVANG